jgi:uncharacterized protein
MEQITPELPPIAAPTGNDKIWGMLCHLSFLLGAALLLPLVVYLAMRKDSVFVEAHAKEALNFHITVYLASLCCIPLMLIVVGFLFLFAIAIASLVFSIIAAIKTSDGEYYRYPVTLRLVK